MLGKAYDDEVCSIARALEVVGERWSLLILRNALFAGSTRYSDFQRSLGIASNILTARLDGFVEAGLMRRPPAGGWARGGGGWTPPPRCAPAPVPACPPNAWSAWSGARPHAPTALGS